MPRTRVKGVLTREQEARGYYLVDAEDIIELWRMDRCVNVFSSSGATPASMREALDQDWQHLITRSLIPRRLL